MARPNDIKPGCILHGPMEGVDHGKFFVVAGVSKENVFVCSVIINSRIHPFIMKRPRLLKRQVKIPCKLYPFLDYDSYVNCAQPLKISKRQFEAEAYTVKDHLAKEDLETVQANIIASGELSVRDVEDFFGENEEA